MKARLLLVLTLCACGARTDLTLPEEALPALDPQRPPPPPPPACLSDGVWSVTGPMNQARAGAALVALAGGDAVVAGGFAEGGPIPSVERYDSATGSWAEVGALAEPRSLFAGVTLEDGRALFTGGYTGKADGEGAGVKLAEIFDPKTGSLSATAPMPEGRYLHAMVRLVGGKVLVVGGFRFDVGTQSALLYDPASGSWTSLPAPASIAGGYVAAVAHDHGAYVLAKEGVYDFDGLTFSKMSFGEYKPSFNVVLATRFRDGFAAINNDGNVWALRGGALAWTRLWIPSPDIDTPVASTILPLCDRFMVVADRIYTVQFDPKPLDVTYIPSPLAARSGVLLDSGALLLAGGYNEDGTSTPGTEIFR